jgi:hypothetical protein
MLVIGHETYLTKYLQKPFWKKEIRVSCYLWSNSLLLDPDPNSQRESRRPKSMRSTALLQDADIISTVVLWLYEKYYI